MFTGIIGNGVVRARGHLGNPLDCAQNQNALDVVNSTGTGDCDRDGTKAWVTFFENTVNGEIVSIFWIWDEDTQIFWYRDTNLWEIRLVGAGFIFDFHITNYDGTGITCRPDGVLLIDDVVIPNVGPCTNDTVTLRKTT